MEAQSEEWSSLSLDNPSVNINEFIHFGSNIQLEQISERNTCDILMVYDHHDIRYTQGRAEFEFYGKISPNEQIKVHVTVHNARS